MRVSVIGGTGHTGKNLTAMLVEAGHEVTVIASGRTPVPDDDIWASVRKVQLVYGSDGWTDVIRDLQPEALVDILQGDSPALYEALKDVCEHFVVCGSLWMLGRPRIVPTPAETQGPCLSEGYVRRYEQLLATKARAAAESKAFTAILCPNICGPYKIPLDCKGDRSIDVHMEHQRGEPVVLPEPGNCLIGPCDAEDTARGFFCAVENREAAADHIFNVGAAYALTAVQFVETYGDIYGVTIPVEFVSWEHFATEVLPDWGANYHFGANMCPDISPISERLGYRPAYTPEETMERAVKWMIDEKLLPR